jgi:hypothetical protein
MAYDHSETMSHMISALRYFALLSTQVTEEDANMAQTAMSQIDTVGPILDPSRYRVLLQNGSLDKQREIINLFISTRDKLRELFPDFRGMDV